MLVLAIPGVCLLQGLRRVLIILFHIIHSIGLFVMFFLFPYFNPKLFCFIYVLVYLHEFSTYLVVEFSFVILEFPVLFVLLDSVLVSFKSSFYHEYLLIYLFKFYRQIFLLFSFDIFIPYILKCFSFLCVFACCRSFSPRHSSLISH